MRSLITLSSDGKSLAKIDAKLLVEAMNDLTKSQQQLASGYASAINSTDLHEVEMVTTGENLTARSAGEMRHSSASKFDLDTGGGKNKPLSSRNTLSVIVMNSQVPVPDFYQRGRGYTFGRNSSAGKLLAHELLGHGVAWTNGIRNSHKDAIQMTNLYMRAQGFSQLYRTGWGHGTGVVLSDAIANAVPGHSQIPFYLQLRLDLMKSLPRQRMVQQDNTRIQNSRGSN